MEYSSPSTVRDETPPVRDANALQRRRRLRLLQMERLKTESSSSLDSTRAPQDLEEPHQQLFDDCSGRTGLHLLIEVNGEAHARKVSLNRPLLLIGSGSECDVRIDHALVRPFHAYIQWIDGRLFCCRLDGKDNQTVWVGAKPVTLGPFRVSVPDLDSTTDVAPDPQSKNGELAAEVSQIQLKFAGVEQSDNLWPIDRRLTLIGRGAVCKLRLDHPEIPIVLAALLRTNRGCWLIDLHRGDELQLNGESLNSPQSLDIGDRLQFGEFQAEVTAAPFTNVPASDQSTKPRTVQKVHSVRELAARHRTHLATLNESLNSVQHYLDTDHFDSHPELKTAIQQYVLHAQRHHREMQDALESLASVPELSQ